MNNKLGLFWLLILGACLSIGSPSHAADQKGLVSSVGERAITATNCPVPVFLQNELEKDAALENIRCEQKGDKLIIKGQVHNLSHTILAGPEVEASLIDANGSVIAKKDAITVPGLLRSKTAKIGLFTIKLPYSSKTKKVALRLTTERREWNQD